MVVGFGRIGGLVGEMLTRHQIPFVAFCVVSSLYIAVTLAKIEHCISVGVQTCK
jgi:voltage-gated potassium channel Kch